MQKDPTKTFIGGMVLGAILGATFMYIGDAHSFINRSDMDRQARCGRAISTMARYSAGDVGVLVIDNQEAQADAIAYCD